MNNAKLYSRFNTLQRSDAKVVISEFSHYLKSRVDHQGCLMDIGTGPGDVLCDFLVPELPENFRIVGVDISIDMIKSAKKNYEDKFITFHKLDISSNYNDCIKELPHELQLFDNITSFYCLHWVQNQV